MSKSSKVSTVSNTATTTTAKSPKDAIPAPKPIKDSRIDNLHSLIIESVKAQRAIDKRGDNVSNSLLLCAKAYQESKYIDADYKGTPNEQASEKFTMACKEEEDFIKSTQAKQNKVDKLPRCWTQAKSNIKAALQMGIDLSKYESESMLRKEVTKLRGQKTQSSFDKKFNQFKTDLSKLPSVDAENILDMLMKQASEAVQALVEGEVVDTTSEVSDSDDQATTEQIAELLKQSA